MKNFFVAVLLLSPFGFASAARADATDSRNRDIERFLRELRNDPATVMKRPPQKWGSDGKPLPAATTKLDAQAIYLKHEAAKEKIIARSTLARALQNPLAAPIDLSNDDPAKLVENPETLTPKLEDLDRADVMTGSTPVQPWSGHYWPYYEGVAANRYGDPLFPSNPDWKLNRKYSQAAGHTLEDFLAANDLDAIDLLSPAEKYDAILGNVKAPLTAALWKSVKDVQDKNGDVPDWQGICEGWSAAAIRTARPAHTVTIQDPAGRAIHFYPSDVKALASVLWAFGDLPTRFVGGRCDQKEPKKDANGRIIDEDCFDANPATWHLIATHELGRLHHPFVIDASANDEVWNQPVQSYSYTYFNPKTDKVTRKLADATVALADLPKDRFKSYRAKETTAVVGIAMDMTYIAENESPTQAPTDSAALDNRTTVRYIYDLELDANGVIIGGEWYQDAHPNFIWMPEPGATPTTTAEDSATGSWDGTGAIPAAWSDAAQKSAAKDAAPLAKVVEVLQKLSAD